MNKMTAKTFVVVIMLALALCVPALQNKKPEANVIIGYYAESLCPDCIAFSNGPLTKAFQQASNSNQSILNATCRDAAKMDCVIDMICAFYRTTR